MVTVQSYALEVWTFGFVVVLTPETVETKRLRVKQPKKWKSVP